MSNGAQRTHNYTTANFIDSNLCTSLYTSQHTRSDLSHRPNHTSKYTRRYIYLTNNEVSVSPDGHEAITAVSFPTSERHHLWPVPIYTAQLQTHMCVNDLLRVAAWQWNSWELNLLGSVASLMSYTYSATTPHIRIDICQHCNHQFDVQECQSC